MSHLVLVADDPRPARFSIVDATGAPRFPYTPHLGHRNERDWAREIHFIAEPPIRLDVPAGPVSIAVERGTEHRPQRIDLVMGDGEERRVVVGPPRWIDMNARGWFSGDLHGHRPDAEMPLLLRSEEINLGTSIATQWRDEPDERVEVPSGDDWLREMDATHAYSRFDAELERIGRAGPGTLVAVGLRRPVRFPCARWDPPDVDFARAAHAAGGHVDAEKVIWPLVPVLAALGQLDSIGLVPNHFARAGTDLDLEPWGARMPSGGRIGSSQALAEWFSELYYRLLNCGFRLPVSGGSASGIMPNPLGHNRTYVSLDEAFSYEGWFAALRQGRSFATNGPMLALAADGHGIGATVRRAGRPLEVRATAEWHEPIERVELIVDGSVVAEAGGSTSVTLEHALPASAGNWLVARAFAGGEPTVRFAHTSPIYLAGAGARARAADAAYLAGWVDETLRDAEAALRGAPDHRARAVLEPIRQAADTYHELAE